MLFIVVIIANSFRNINFVVEFFRFFGANWENSRRDKNAETLFFLDCELGQRRNFHALWAL